MKKKTFILTLMMLLCSIAFGQHWSIDNESSYPSNMMIFAEIEINGVKQMRTDLEIAAFHQSVVRGTATPQYNSYLNKYITTINIVGSENKELITFKLYDPTNGKELNSDFNIEFYDDSTIGSIIVPQAINFEEKHWNYNVDTENTMTVACTIKINGIVQERTDLELAAFCGDKIRGVAKPEYWAGPNVYIVSLRFDGKNGDEITFKLYDPILDEELPTEYTVTFVKDAMIGDEYPIAMDFITSPYVAQIGETKYQSFDAALAAAQDDDEIILLADINLTETAVVSKDINIALNGKTVAGTIELAHTGATVTGAQGAVTSVVTNIADHKVVYENNMYKVVAKDYVAQVGTTKYEILSEAYAAANETNGIVLLSDITLESAWKIEKAINIALGEYKVAGTIELANAGATVTGAQNAVTSVITNIADHKVVYENNMYKVVAKVYVAQVGSTKYETLEEAYNAATATNGIVLLSNVTLQTIWKIEKAINISLNGKTISGTIELANTGATVTGAQDAVTSVITNIADHKVVYENNMYKVVAKVYVAQVGTTKYETIQAAVNAATAGQTVTIIANVSSEAVEVNKNITITDNGELVLNDVSINAVDGASSLTVSNLSFTGNSWINSGAASELVVSGVTADVTPSNASVTNSRSAFISLGRSEQKTLELTVENSSIIARGGSDAILGWAAITEANITGNTFGSASAYQTSSDCVKFMAIANNAVLNITNNNVYSNYNGIVFGQNTTRDNAYTVNVDGNNFYGGADHIWLEVSGSNTCHATINATISNKVNGNAFTANDIKVHPNLNTWTSYGGVDVVFDSNNKIIGGTFKYIADNVIAEGYEKSANTDDTYSIVKSISGKIAYRAYINDTEAREAVQVDLTNIIAKQSVVVKLYDANGNVLTTTSLKAGGIEAANLTCNIVLWGDASSSWETTIHTTLTVENIPAKIELWIDGTLKDTFENALGAGTNVDETAKYIALNYVYKEARIGNTYYATINNAIAAAQSGQTIVLLADVTLANAIDITGKTLDLNGKTVKADIIGKILINNGLWVTAEGYKMIGKNADYYATTDAAIVMGANYSIEMISGTVNLAKELWYTLQGQNITIKQGATFNISAGQTFVINGSTVENNGTVNNAGTIQILESATVKGNITGNLHFKGGNYITADNHKMVGTTNEYHYNATDALVNIATNGDITIAAGAMTLGHDWRTLPGQTVTVAEGATFTVPSGMTYQIYGTAIVNGTITVNGTVELAALEATLKAQEGLTIESGVEGNKVVYENGMYKLTPMNAYFKGGAYARYVASKDREHFSITLGDVYAKQSLVVKVYSGETLLLTTTYRAEDLDNPGVNRYPVISDKLTVNNVVSGKVSGSWLNEYAQGVELTIANVPDKFEVYADGDLKDTYDGTTSELKGFGSEKDLNTYLGFEGVYKAASITNAAGTEYYMTLAEALADVKKDDVLNLHDNATIANPINVTSNLTINGNGKTLTYTGSNRAIEVTAGDFTAENLTIVANGERGINYNVANGNLTLNNVEVEGTSTYALNLPGLSDGANVVINNSSLTGKIALNVWGEKTTITTTTSHFISVDNNAAENYAAIVFNNDGTTSCAGTTIVMDGGSIIAKDQNGNPSTAVSNSAVVNFVEGENYSVNNATTIVGEIKTPVAIVTYEGQNAFYSCYTFQDAIDEAIETKGSVKLLTNVASSEIITINGEVKIDGNNKTLTSTATRAINVDYKGKVTICNLTIATINKTERAINVIQKAAELTLNNVTAEGFKYTIFVAGSSVGSTINTIGGKFSGYAAVNITGSGTTFNSNGTELIGINNAQLHESNNYAVIAVNTVPTENVNVNINGGKVSAQTNVNRQFIATVRYAENANITIDAELGLVNGDVLNATIEDIENNGLIVKVRDDYADELYAQGYATSTADANGLVTVLGKAIYEQRHTLGAGWNWFSSYININGTTGFEKLQTALGTSGLHIKNQHQFVDYNQGWGWNGTLESTSVEEMYMIQTSAEVELVLAGDIVNPADIEITLNEGWTYIGYPVATAMNIEDALKNITPNDGDIIKTHGGGVAQYYAEWNKWYSQSLQSMTPGFGYMYRNTSGSVKEFTYPTANANTRAEVRANVTSENNRWVPNASAFANNMNIIAVLESNDMMGEFEVAAFVNGEVRGSARPTYVEPIDAYVLFMTIYGEEGEEMTFKYYDIYSDEEHVISNTVAYSDNAVIGSIKEPYMFFANTLGMDENAANTLSLYPNPTTTNAAISFETIYDMVEVFNALGSKVAEYSNVDRIEGMEAAGVYVIRVTNDNAVQNCRLIVK